MVVMDWIRKLTDIIMPVGDEYEVVETKKPEIKAAEITSAQEQQPVASAQTTAETLQTTKQSATGNILAQGFGGGMSFTRNGGMVSTAESGVTSMGGVRYEAYSSETSVKPSLAVVKTPQLTMKIYTPKSYDDQCKQIVDDLIKHNAVIVNLEGVSEVEQQRIGDFVVGAVYTISGKVEKISNKIVLYVPSGIEYETAAATASSMRRYN